MTAREDAHHAHVVTFRAHWEDGRRKVEEVRSTACACGQEPLHARARTRAQAEYLGGAGSAWQVTGAAVTEPRARDVARETAKALAHLHHPLLTALRE